MRTLSDHPYRAFLDRLRSPSRYVGGEFGSATPPADAEAAIVLAFPDVYEVGMSHLGTQILYRILAGTPGVRVERAFSPWPDLEAALRERGLPLVSLESHAPLSSFDVVGVSMQHELCFTNVLNLLDLGGIPLRAADRDATAPIVLAGGPGAHHPEPMAPFFDAVFVGEAEAHLPDLVLRAGRMRRAGASRAEVLAALAARPGVYVPGLYAFAPGPSGTLARPIPAAPGLPERIRRVVVDDLDAHPIPTRTIVPWNRAVFDRVSMEIARGCSEGCRFCEAGYAYRPLRDRSPDAVFRDTLAAVRHAGYEEVSLGALSPADYPALGPLVHALSGTLTPDCVTLSVSSLRAYGLDDRTLKDLRAVRAAGLTMAPEAGSQRLRDVINKNVRDEDLMASARRAFANGWQRLKLYFMVGLPTETDEDVDAIVALARAVLRMGRGMGRASVTASVGVFVPRPHTPFQWEGMAPPEAIDRKLARLREAARGTGVTLKHPDGRGARLECAMARGDRRMADVIEHAFRLGCRFDDWTEHARPDLWAEAFVRAGVDWDALTRPLPQDAALPWEVVDVGVTRAFLARERARALEARTTPPCEKPAERDGVRPGAAEIGQATTVVCHACGAGCVPADIASARAAVVRAGAGLPSFDEAPEPADDAAAAGVATDIPAEDGVDAGGVPEADEASAGDADATGEAGGRQRSAGGAPDAGAWTHWHLVFTKVGPAAYLSQKDLVKHLPRILRRAGLKARMSGGFHPLPKVSYREPMPVGYQGAGEWMDAWLAADGGAPDLDALNRASVSGIAFLRVDAAAGRRRPPGDIRYAFASPLDADATAARLAPLRVEPPTAAEAASLAAAGLDPDPIVGRDPLVLVWPRGAHLPHRPHETLSLALGREFLPGELVRLYDDPRGATDDPDAGAGDDTPGTDGPATDPAAAPDPASAPPDPPPAG